MTFYTSLVEVVTAMFPGEKNGKKPITEDLSAAPPEQFASRVTQLLSG